MKQNILAISGKPGLFLLIARGAGTIIVETLDQQKKRFNVGLRDRVTSLNEVSIYTDEEDVKLMDVFTTMFKLEDGKSVDIDLKQADKATLTAYMEKVLPNFDRERVYPNDMKKLIQWYNILVGNGFTDFTEQEEGAGKETATDGE